MSKILRRPMFRGGPVDSYGTGIATGLASGGRVGFDNGGAAITRRARARIRGPQDFPLNTSLGSVFNADLGSPIKTRSRIRGPRDFLKGSSIEDAEGLLASNAAMNDATLNVPTYDFEQEDELVNVGDVELGLPKSKVEDLTTEKVVEKVDIKDDEPEVTMTDLEKALGLDKARRRDLGDMLGRASAAFLGAGDVREGLAEFMAAETKAGPSRTERIKSIAGLEEFKARKQQELFDKKAKRDAEMKAGTKGSVQKTVDFLVSQGMDKDEAIRRATKQAGTFAEALGKNSVGGTILSQGFALAAEEFYGNDYKGDVTAVEVIEADKSTNLPDGIYSDKDNKLIFEVKDKKVVFDRSYS